MTIRPPQFVPPTPGITLEQRFEVTLDAVPSGDCISVVQGQATLLIARPILEQVSAATPETWTTEQERLALIRGGRAKALLQSLTPSMDAFGCASVRTPLSNDSLYLVSELLQSGQVAVMDNETCQRIRHIVVRFNGVRAGPLAGMGHVSYAFTRQSAPFLWLSWWVS